MKRRDTRIPKKSHPLPVALLVSLWGATICPAQVIEGDGWSLHKISSRPVESSGGTPFDGDTYSFVHETGAMIDGQFQCFSEHLSGTTDSTVTFDGISETVDSYVDGTQPRILEFENTFALGGQQIIFDTSLDTGTDLFPEGFEDPETGTPLTDACVEIGRDDLLDASVPTTVTSATLQTFGDVSIGPLDITNFFEDPWDGRLSIVFTDLAGAGIDGVVLDLQTQPIDPTEIFADGFESGDATSWTK